VELDVEPRVVVEPTDFAHALDADPAARAAYDRLSYSHKREHVGAIESAKKPETRSRRIEAAVANLRNPESKKGSVPRSETRATKPSADLRKYPSVRLAIVPVGPEDGHVGSMTQTTKSPACSSSGPARLALLSCGLEAFRRVLCRRGNVPHCLAEADGLQRRHVARAHRHLLHSSLS
jgi:hypothetical protein